MSENDYDFPVHEQLEVQDGETIFKNDDWWKAVVVCDSWNGNEVNVYLWQNQDGDWKRKQKYKINDEGQWLKTKKVIDGFTDEYID
jgi:hypothetical protein